MRWPRRPELLLAIAGAALLSSPGGTRGTRLGDSVGTPEYATVGRIVSRRVDGRTIVLIPVAGPVRERLSEPFQVGSRWRLYLTLEGARLGIYANPRRGPGVLDISVAESGSDVRISVDIASMTSYGTRPSEEGLLLWIEDEGTAEHRAREQAQALPIIGDGPRLSTSQVAPEPEPGGGGWLRLVLVLAGAAALVLGIRAWKRKGTMPRWVEVAGVFVAGAVVAALRNKVLGSTAETEETPGIETPEPEQEPETTELRKTG